MLPQSVEMKGDRLADFGLRLVERVPAPSLPGTLTRRPLAAPPPQSVRGNCD